MAGSTAMRIGILADDLTGAMDVAGPFAAVLPDTRVLALPQARPDDLGAAMVLSVNTASRHLPAAQAAAAVTRAATLLGQGGARLLLKKVDSTLRGHVVAETCALLACAPRARVLVAPAFPAQGRVVSAGMVHVRGVPLARTEFATDALSPPPLEPLDTLFARALPQAQVVAVAAGQALPPPPAAGLQVLVGDASVDADLDTLLAGLGDSLADTLLVGSAGLAGALARSLAPAGVVVAQPPARRVLFLVGSRSASSAAQVEALIARPDCALIEAPDGVVAAGAAWAQETCVLRATAGPGASAQVVAQRLARAGLEQVRTGAFDTVVATGGDTAVAFLAAAGTPVLAVHGDLLPGLPHTGIVVDGRPLRLVTKAGGFGQADTLVRLLQLLRG